MALIIPQTWTAIAESVANFNTYIRDQSRQLIGHSANPKPFAIVHSAADFALTQDVFNFVEFDTTIINRGGLFDGTTGLQVPTGWAGLYHVTANVDIDAYAGNKELRICVNADEAGVASQNIYGVGSPAFARMNCSADVWLDEGDILEMIVFHDYPGTINALGGTLTRFSAFWVATDN